MKGLRNWRLWALLGIAAGCASVPLFVQNDYFLQVLFRIALFASLGLAWNLVGGYAGQLSLGHVAFFGVGAYGLAIFTELGIPRWISLLLAAGAATLVAALIGRIVFRLRGPYFTLATIASGEVLRLVATNLKTTGGAIGLTTPALFTGQLFWKWFYLAAVGLTVFTLIINYSVSRSRFGYYLMAIREDEETARAVGIDSSRCKLQSLLLSAFLTALAGALYGSAFQFIIPDSVLPLEISVQIAIIAMLGGAGTLIGPVVGAVVLLSASELFKNQFKESHLLIYGILIVVVVLFMPEGIVGALQHLFRKRVKAPEVPVGLAPGGPDLSVPGTQKAS
jgi:branched-chain amino acid transport system permease protein